MLRKGENLTENKLTLKIKLIRLIRLMGGSEGHVTCGFKFSHDSRANDF